MIVKLIHLREDKNEIILERRSIVRTSGLKDNELISVDFFSEGLSENYIKKCDAIIVGGSKFGVAKNDLSLHPKNLSALVNVLENAKSSGTPYLGLCFGAQLLAYVFRGEVIYDKGREEIGTFEICKTKEAAADPLFRDLPKKFMAQCAHHDYVTKLPKGAILLATSALCPVQAFRVGSNMYGLQFHPETSKEDYEEVIRLRFKDHGMQAQHISKLVPSKEAETMPQRFIDIFVRSKNQL